MKYKVIFWDDRNDCQVKEVIVNAINFEEAEEKAKVMCPSIAERYPILDTVGLSEEESDAIDRAQEKEDLKKELQEFGIETYLHEHLKTPTSQLVLSKLCGEVLDTLSEEDLDALTSRVIEQVLEDM